MITYIIDLLIIASIVELVNLSGFWEVIDNEINKRFKFYHLPHIFQCTLCQTFWLNLFYTLIMGKITLINVCIILIVAHLSELIPTLFLIFKGVLKKIMDFIIKKIY